MDLDKTYQILESLKQSLELLAEEFKKEKEKLNKRQCQLDEKEKALFTEKEELSSFRNVSVVNGLNKKVSDLSNENELLRRGIKKRFPGMKENKLEKWLEDNKTLSNTPHFVIEKVRKTSLGTHSDKKSECIDNNDNETKSIELTIKKVTSNGIEVDNPNGKTEDSTKVDIVKTINVEQRRLPKIIMKKIRKR